MADLKAKGKDSKDKGKDDSEDKPKEKADLSAKVAHVVENDVPLQLFVAHDPKCESHPAKWIVDSGASVHMSCRRDWFQGFRALVPM